MINIGRRVKIITLDARLLVEVLNWARNPHMVLALPVTEEIPADADVLSIRANWESECLEAMIFHSSFGLVAPGCNPPHVPGLISTLRRIEQREVVEA